MARVKITSPVFRKITEPPYAPLAKLTPAAGAQVQVNFHAGPEAPVYAAETGAGELPNPLTADDLGRVSGWVDPNHYDLVVSGGGIAEPYTQPWHAADSAGSGAGGEVSQAELDAVEDTLKAALALNAKDYALGDGTDQTAGLQAFFNAMQADGRAGYIPEGDWRYTTLTRDATLPFVLRGAGKGLTKLRPLADAGPGTYALGFTGSGNEYRHRIEHLSIIGPGAQVWDGSMLGVRPCEMHGLRVPQGATVHDVEVESFNHNLSLLNDHHRILDCQSHFGYFNVYFEDQVGHGNTYMEQCEIEFAYMASIGISRKASLVWSSFRDVHMGLGPYAIYLEPGVHVPPGGLSSLQNVHFDECSFEWLGNGLLYDDGATKVAMQVKFTQCGDSFGLGGGTIPTYLNTKPKDFLVSVNGIIDMEIDGGLIQPGDEGIIEAPSYAHNVNFKNALYAHSKCIEENKRMLKTPSSAGAWLETTGVRARLMRVSGVSGVARYDLVAHGGSPDVCVLYNDFDLFRMPAGVATQDGLDGEYIPVVYQGAHSVKTDDTIAAPSYGLVVKADQRGGKKGKVRSPGTSLDPVVGVLNGASAAGNVLVDLQPSPYVPDPEPVVEDRSCLLSRATALTVADQTYVNVPWTTERSDPHGWHATDAVSVFVDEPGLYLVNVDVRWATAGFGVRLVNLTLDPAGAAPAVTVAQHVGILRDLHLDRALRLAAGDELYVTVWQDTGADLDVERTADLTPMFEVVQLGP